MAVTGLLLLTALAGPACTPEAPEEAAFSLRVDPLLHFGLGQKTKVDSLEILWPSGMVTLLRELPAGQIIAVEEGKGVVERLFPRVTGD
jgi:hypothetical protein